MNPRIFLALFILPLTARCYAQKLPQIDSKVAEKNLITKVEPCYPPVARFAHVQGNVVVGIAIGIDGKVDAAEVLSGPAMLQVAALRTAKQYEYKPFEQEGHPAQVATKVSIGFSFSPNDLGCKANDQAWKPYDPLEKKCTAALQAHSIDQQLLECKEALDFATAATPGNHRIQVAEAYRHHGIALLHGGRAQEALAQFNQDVMNESRYMDINEPTYVSAFAWRGVAFDALGQDEKASADYSTAETIYRRYAQRADDEHKNHPFIRFIDGFAGSPSFKLDFTMVLNKHAAILEKRGEIAAATALRHEAAEIAQLQTSP